MFKITLIGKHTNRDVLLKFGIPAIAASFAGAWVLFKITAMPALLEYQIGEQTFTITPVKLIIATLLITFSLMEILPAVQKIQFNRNKLVLGGILSGFFGGLSGLQGAIRSAFLIKSGLTKEAYIATGVFIACLVDLTRLSVYASKFSAVQLNQNLPLLISATLAAMAGALLGNRLLRKVTLRSMQLIVAILLIVISVALGMGVV
ncbi:MAG: TSUP family transporter [Bacteroidetes bacterium]|nr:TSUP family transporter [Bacteroidota bacterium]